MILYKGKESMGDNNADGDDSIKGNNIYKSSREKPVLVLLLDCTWSLKQSL